MTTSFEEQEETVITLEQMACEPHYLYQPNSHSYLVYKSCSTLGI